MSYQITLSDLEKARACEESRTWFAAAYPRGLEDWREELRRCGGWPPGVPKCYFMWLVDIMISRRLAEVDLSGLNLRGLTLPKDHAYAGWRFCGADLRDAALMTCDLRGADLGGARLRGASVWEAFVTDTPGNRAALEKARNVEGVIFA